MAKKKNTNRKKKNRNTPQETTPETTTEIDQNTVDVEEPEQTDADETLDLEGSPEEKVESEDRDESVAPTEDSESTNSDEVKPADNEPLNDDPESTPVITKDIGETQVEPIVSEEPVEEDVEDSHDDAGVSKSDHQELDVKNQEQVEEQEYKSEERIESEQPEESSTALPEEPHETSNQDQDEKDEQDDQESLEDQKAEEQEAQPPSPENEENEEHEEREEPQDPQPETAQEGTSEKETPPIEPTEHTESEHEDSQLKSKATSQPEVTPEVQTEVKPEAPQENKEQSTQISPVRHPSISLKSSTSGPYTLHDLIPNFEFPHDREITTVQAYQTNVYIGTSYGEIYHYELKDSIPKLINIQKFHPSRQKPIQQILILPTINHSIVTSASLLQVFTLPDMKPSSIGKIKDVNFVCLDTDHKAKEDSSGVHVIVYISSKIRIVNVTKTSLRLVKDIAYGDVSKGLRRGEYAVVCGSAGSQSANYDLIDLENDGKISLFPLKTDSEYNIDEKNKLQPFIAPVSHSEFLLTCGTQMNEPAMGLVVNNEGDISRGTIPFEKYPNSLEIDDLLVIAGFDDVNESGYSVVVYSIHDQSELQRFTFDVEDHEEASSLHRLKVLRLSNGFKQNHNGLVDLIRLAPLRLENAGDDAAEKLIKETEFAKGVSKIESSLTIHTNNSISLLVPKPRLERLVDEISPQLITEYKKPINIDELEDELKSTDASTELGFIETEFLNTLIALIHLKNHNYSSAALEIYTNGTIDPRILISIIDESCVFGSVWLFNGLVQIVEILRLEYQALVKAGMSKRKQLNDISRFFGEFLSSWLKKEYIEDEDLLKSLRIMNLKWNIHQEDLSPILQSAGQYDETLSIIESNGRYRALTDIYLQRERYQDGLKILRSLVDGELSDTQTKESKESTLLLIIDLIYKHFSSNDALIDDYGKWLLKIDVNKGMNFFSNLKRDTSSTSDELMILEQIDDLGLQLEYVEKILVRLKKERNLGNLRKSLYKGVLRSLS